VPFENPILIAMLHFLAGSAARPFSFCELTRAPCCDFWPAQLPAHFHLCEVPGPPIFICFWAGSAAEQLNCAKCANLINSNGEVRLPQPPQQQQQQQQQQATEKIPRGTVHSPRRASRSLRPQQRTAADRAL